MHISNQTIKFSWHGLVMNGQRYCYQVRPQDVIDDPYWNPETEPPPLAIAKAIQIGKEAIKKYVETDEEWKLGRINFNCIEYGKWIYVLMFGTDYDIEKKRTPQMFVILLKMDGTVIDPIPENDQASNIHCNEAA